jgi:hypothetical protein
MAKTSLMAAKLKCPLLAKLMRAGVAAARLSMSTRQIRRLVRRYRAEGPVGLISRRCRRPSNNRLEAAVENQVVRLLREHYADFGPTLAAEKLAGRHQIVLAKETVRRDDPPSGRDRPATRDLTTN